MRWLAFRSSPISICCQQLLWLVIAALDVDPYEWASDASSRPPPDKENDPNTVSLKFKSDLVDAFSDKAGNWTMLEIGSHVGYNTRVLAGLFDRVLAVDASVRHLELNAAYNAVFTNIMFMKFHTFLDDWATFRLNAIDVVMIDAEHDYDSVKRDLANVLSIPSVRFVVFDDYATYEDIRRVVLEAVDEGALEIVRHLGHDPPWTHRGETLVHPEGVVCRVISQARIPAVMQWLGSTYRCYTKAFRRPLGNITFTEGGGLDTSWGHAGWALQTESEMLLAEWPKGGRVGRDAWRPTPPGGIRFVVEFNVFRTSFVAFTYDNHDMAWFGIREDIYLKSRRLVEMGLRISATTMLFQAL